MLRRLIVAALLASAAPSAAQSLVLDPEYGAEGVATFRVGASSSAYDLALLPDDSVVLAGTSDGTAVAVAVDPAGQPLRSFGSQGVARIPLSGVRGFLTSITRLDAGDFLASGFALNSANGVAYSFVARLTDAGALDPAFGTSGVARLTGADPVLLAGVEPLPGGGALAYGSVLREGAPAAPVTARLLADGALDATYGTGGTARLDLAVSVNDGLRLADGRLVLAGSQLVDGADDAVLLGLRPDGTLDAGFAADGVALVPLSDDLDAFTSLTPDEGGRLVAGGYARSGAAGASEAVAARVTLDGQLDQTFGGGGLAKNAFTDRVSISTVVVRSGGRVLLSGVQGQPSQPFLAQFLADGAADGGFGAGGVASVGAREGTVTLAAHLDGKGRVVLAGYAPRSGVATEMTALRLAESSATTTGPAPGAEGLALAHARSHPAATLAVRLTLAAAGDLTVDVVDVLGRTVARLHDGPTAAGAQTLTAGRALPAGRYVVRAVAADGRRAVLPVVVVR